MLIFQFFSSEILVLLMFWIKTKAISLAVDENGFYAIKYLPISSLRVIISL